MRDSWLAFVPRDTVFVRDGRSFDARADASARSVRPGPATLAGAVGAAYGDEPNRVLGPVLARRAGDGWAPYFPVPADLVATADEARPYVFRLGLVEVPGLTDLGAGPSPEADAPGRWLMPPEHAEPVEPLSGWLPGELLADYLAGTLPGPDGCAVEDLDLVDPLHPERRVGLARDGARRARSGYLYQATHLRPEEGWAFLAQCVLPADWQRAPAGPVQIGGRGRLADVEPAAVRWPAFLGSGVGGRVLVYVATPAIWPDGWRLPVPAGARLAAAAVGEPEPAATMTPGQGWRASRALRWAVPAGSVYLLEFDDAAQGAAWARAVHGTALGSVDDRLCTAGFGVVLTGAWM